jgi:hypothetical protein
MQTLRFDTSNRGGNDGSIQCVGEAAHCSYLAAYSVMKFPVPVVGSRTLDASYERYVF